MRRLLLSCALSLTLYVAAFAFLLDRPLTLGALRARIEANLTLGRTTNTPKLVILAGSNGPYSHRCETIQPLIGRPCINAGIAVGVGLDYLFTRWKPLLRPGDIVYLPLEEAQYTRPQATSDLGPDATIMLRHDRTTLLAMPPRRWFAALFSGDLRGAVMSVIETTLVSDDFSDPRAATSGGYNRQGDHIGHTAGLAAANQSALAAVVPFHPTAEEIAAGYGTELISAFIRWASLHGVRVIGGLPVGFTDSPLNVGEKAAIQAVFRAQGADFLETPEGGRYPRSAFFDTPDHLNETVQIMHSVAVARGLEDLMGRKLAQSR
ncbi:MAG TPA: hypothetical protein DDZ81_16175 [Acetobacteraceae bacterium]|jgi:hypothetical protein|nr:hypothetical protein [Acetobacteraceae bacterium]